MKRFWSYVTNILATRGWWRNEGLVEKWPRTNNLWLNALQTTIERQLRINVFFMEFTVVCKSRKPPLIGLYFWEIDAAIWYLQIRVWTILDVNICYIYSSTQFKLSQAGFLLHLVFRKSPPSFLKNVQRCFLFCSLSRWHRSGFWGGQFTAVSISRCAFTALEACLGSLPISCFPDGTAGLINIRWYFSVFRIHSDLTRSPSVRVPSWQPHFCWGVAKQRISQVLCRIFARFFFSPVS